MTATAPDVVRLETVTKSFGVIRALATVDFDVGPGECVGLVGHNGAGKSTLMHVLAGTLPADSGTVAIGGALQPEYGVALAQRLGIRCIFQELSLCPNLTVAENTRVLHPTIAGWGWRRRAGRLVTAKLDEIFPGHGIATDTVAGDLPIGKRQMVEVARAFTVTADPLCLVILDEPTSSLDSHTAGQLLAYVRRVVTSGVSCILISHLLGEILDTCDRIVVMRDGAVVSNETASAFDRQKLVATMGGAQAEKARVAGVAPETRIDAAVRVRARPSRSGGVELVAYEGEVIGLAGLSGHGQTALLLAVYTAASSRVPGVQVTAPVALVAGDRQSDGIFPLWSIAQNIGVRSMKALRRGPLIARDLENDFADRWRKRIGIRTPDLDNNILSLSGGNQQKALFARALGSDAKIVLMDDPMRGVDVATKLEVYDIIRAEAVAGRTFLWYTTEMEELDHCDRVYIFRNERIVAELHRGELSEERVIHSSFQDVA